MSAGLRGDGTGQGPGGDEAGQGPAGDEAGQGPLWTGIGRHFSLWRLDVECLCLGGLETEASSSLRQASSSWDRVLGGGRGGMAGSWMKGWAGWWARR